MYQYNRFLTREATNTRCPPDSVQHPPDSVQHPPDSVQHPPDSVQHPPDSVQHPPDSVSLLQESSETPEECPAAAFDGDDSPFFTIIRKPQPPRRRDGE